MKVAHFMQTEVTRLKPDTSLAKAWKIFSDHKISGAPVVDDSGKLVGVLSQTDLVKEAYSSEHSHYPPSSFFVEFPFWTSVTLDNEIDDLELLSVGQRMTTEVITVSPSDSISDAAGRMRSLKIHRLIVTENDAVVGILSTFDLLKALEEV